jgi:DNA replication ATP-dependent helicase Dna2
MPRRAPYTRTEPAHSFFYAPAQLHVATPAPDTAALLTQVSHAFSYPFNARQAGAFARSFTERLVLLWGPPGTGKTTVLAGIILGWLERAWQHGEPVCVGVGASNYTAIDNELTEVAEALEHRYQRVGVPPLTTRLLRVRSASAAPPLDARITNIARNSDDAMALAGACASPQECLLVGGTWMQLGRLAAAMSQTREPAAPWFDLLLLDEASQVPVAAAAAYFLLLKPEGHVVLAGDHKQLGPIYGFAVHDSGHGLFDCIFTYMRETHGQQPVALEQNYRTNLEIAAWPKARFYSEGYEAFFPQRRLHLSLPPPCGHPPVPWPSSLPWSDLFLTLLDPAMPVTVISYAAQTFTLSNPFEAQLVASLAYLYRCLLHREGQGANDRAFWANALGIVTPYRAQMATIRNLLVEAAGMPMDPPPFVDTVDRFQGQERDLMIASYVVADRDFVASEEAFILNPRRFNVTLTRARSKFIMFVSEAILHHLPSDADVARDAAHLQLFVEEYCTSIREAIVLPYVDGTTLMPMACILRGRTQAL